jgi:hypothetical protein
MYAYAGCEGRSVLLYKIAGESNDGHWTVHKEQEMEID